MQVTRQQRKSQFGRLEKMLSVFDRLDLSLVTYQLNR